MAMRRLLPVLQGLSGQPERPQDMQMYGSVGDLVMIFSYRERYGRTASYSVDGSKSLLRMNVKTSSRLASRMFFLARSHNSVLEPDTVC